MVLMPCSKCCKISWRCFTDGDDYTCVGPNDTPPDGWTTDGISHATELDCMANCGVIQCYRNTAEQRQYRCFSSLELDPDQKIWQPTSTVIYEGKEACETDCGPRGMCCLPEGTCINTTGTDCAYRGGTFFEGYVSTSCAQFGFDPLCSKVDCENILCFEDGQPEECVTYTVKIKATNQTPESQSAGVLSWVDGTPSQNPYPFNQDVEPSPYGPKIDSIWPNEELDWESAVTVGPDEEGELVASLNISELMSLRSHWNAQQPDNQLPDTAGEPLYTGSFGCEVESVIPFRVLGCDTGCLQLWFGDSKQSLCNLPEDAGKVILRYTDPDCQLPGCPNEIVYEAGGLVEIGRSFLSIPTGSPSIPCIGNCEYGDAGEIITCNPCSGGYTVKTELEYWFGPYGSGGPVSPAFLWWPTSEDQSKGWTLGTAYNVRHVQEWEITVSINPVDCDEQRKAKADKEKDAFMGLRNKAPTTGPGTELKNMLAAWGIHAKKGGGCKCRDMEVKMNRWGSDCTKHMDAIVDHLQAEAKKRGLPFVRRAGEMLVKRAINRFEKES